MKKFFVFSITFYLLFFAFSEFKTTAGKSRRNRNYSSGKIKNKPTRKEIYYEKLNAAKEAYEKKNYDIALSIAEKIIDDKKMPHLPEVFTLSGDCLFHLKAYREAYQSYLSSLYILSDSIVYDKARETLKQMDNPRLITIKLKRVINKKPNDFVIRNILTSFYIQLKLYKDAIGEAQKVLSINPWDHEALANISLAYLYSNDPGLAEKYSDLAEREGIISDRLHFIRGYIHVQKDGNFHEAEKEFIKAIKLNPYSQVYYYNLAFLYVKLKRLNDAIMLLKRASKIDPKNEKVIFALAQSYFLSGKTDRALETYRYLTGIYPQSVDGYLGLGKIYLMLNQYGKAIKYFKLARKFDNDTLKYVNFLEIYFQKYFYLILTVCAAGIFATAYMLKKSYEESPRL